MCPKSFCIKTSSKEFIDLLDNQLSVIPSVRYIKKKINGEYSIIIKCFNYYNKFNNMTTYSFYGSYIYLYTNLSLLLSELFISFYEKILIKRIISMHYFYFSDLEQKQILNISLIMLDPEFNIPLNDNMYLYRKEKILNNLLINFRKQNYLNADAFVNFSIPYYIEDLEAIVDQAVQLYLTDKQYVNLIKLILQSLFY